MGPVDYVALHAQLYPDRPAVLDLDSKRRVSYRELDEAVSRCVSALLARGCQVGDRVACVAKNDLALIVLFIACARAGMLFAPLNHRLAERELQDLLDLCEPKVLVGDTRVAQALRVDLTVQRLWAELQEHAPAPAGVVDADAPSLILFSSGTTGRPKGVLLSTRNLLETAVNFSIFGAVTSESVFLLDAPMFHVIGLANCVCTPLYAGASVLVSAGFEPAETARRLADVALRVSHYFCVPQMLDAVAAAPTFEVTRIAGRVTVFTGGAPHSADSIRRFLNVGLRISHGYGMTEAGCVAHCIGTDEVMRAHAGSIGLSTPRVQCRVVDEVGLDCAHGVAGELLVRGDNVALGYFRDEEATRAVFRDGWFHSGDLARRDPDGTLWIVGRKKDMFISGGENIYPAEIELRLEGYPGIADAAVVGVPDARWGEVGHLAVVASEGAAPRPTPEALLRHLEASLARYKVPKYVTFLPQLPRTANGKLRRGALRALVTD
jgi:fatty-acyl-CoA synthase